MLGASASTRRVSVVIEESLPAASVALPVTSKTPLVSRVCGAVIDTTPLPGLPSGKEGSVEPVNVTVTESRYQPAASGARSGAATGAVGGVRSTTTGLDGEERAVTWLPSSAAAS